MQTNYGIVTLVVAKLVCCGLLVLAAAGLLGGIIGWLSGSEIWFIAMALVSALALLVSLARRSSHSRAKLKKRLDTSDQSVPGSRLRPGDRSPRSL